MYTYKLFSEGKKFSVPVVDPSTGLAIEKLDPTLLCTRSDKLQLHKELISFWNQ